MGVCNGRETEAKKCKTRWESILSFSSAPPAISARAHLRSCTLVEVSYTPTALPPAEQELCSLLDTWLQRGWGSAGSTQSYKERRHIYPKRLHWNLTETLARNSPDLSTKWPVCPIALQPCTRIANHSTCSGSPTRVSERVKECLQFWNRKTPGIFVFRFPFPIPWQYLCWLLQLSCYTKCSSSG